MATLIKIEQGTAFHSGQNLCRSCVYGWVRETTKEEAIFCENVQPTIRMRDPVVRCSQYKDKTATSLNDMYKMAFILETDKRKNVVGFVSAKEWFKKNEDIDPEAWRVQA